MQKDQLKEKYLNSAILYRDLVKKEERHLVILSVLRLFIFIGGLILIWAAFTKSIPAGIILSLLITVLFIFLLELFSDYSQKREFLGNLVEINQNETNALSGNLSAFDTGISYTDIKHDFSFDIDLFGVSSLFQYLNRTVTGYGRDILASWLSDPFILSGKLELRQEAIKELSSKDKWRQEFMASGMKIPLEKSEISGLLIWIEEGARINASYFKKLLIFALPAAAIASLMLTITGILPYPVFVSIFLVNLFYTATGLVRINEIHNGLTKKYNFLSSMNRLLKAFEDELFASPVLNEIKENISGEGFSAIVSVKKLGRLIQNFDSRNNQLVGVILNGLLLWDYQSIRRLEKWKAEYKTMFPLWLEMIGQVDAYISLGNYAFNNPDFVYPLKADNNNVFLAKNLGHQLIDEKKRICNDFNLGEKGTVCIISGANMAGKSTFLRTIAVNYILGMIGAPVCATEMQFIPGKLFTSMRTTDSLSDNESYFYAELRRLNTLKSRIEEGEPVFFILDEILKGTNSSDKSTGSKLFLKKIVENGGTGLLATHDTSLGKLESEYPGVIINKCFEIEIDGETIRFDYKLQNGITQKMNAVFLMKQMGILD
jgi:ABC-type multidrug transport system fused ATPase/permease subunit